MTLCQADTELKMNSGRIKAHQGWKKRTSFGKSF